jgi:hypothetical protein
MTLAGMLALDEDAFICDIAETYQIYDYKRVPCRLLGTLASGLRDSSRIKQKMAGIITDPKTVLLASCLDTLNILVWMRTKDGQEGKNRPKSVAKSFYVKEEWKMPEHPNSLTIEEFEEIRKKTLKKG